VTICPHCGTDDVTELFVAESAVPRYLCIRAHRWSAIEFRSHRYVPPLQYVAAYGSVTTGPVVLGAVPEMSCGYEVGEIHCGPPAPLPAVPTPEEILRHAAGLGRVLLDPDGAA
jgi:hypothetical protein